jgi:hypothetical protein
MPIGEIGPSDLREQDHFRHWKRAVHEAIQAADEELEPGEGAWFTVGLELHITRESPGWADGYRVVLTKT